MTQKANILSFNEVKARGASAPHTVSAKRTPTASSSSSTRASSRRSASSVNAFQNTRASRQSRFASTDYTAGVTSVDGASRMSALRPDRGEPARFVGSQRRSAPSATRSSRSTRVKERSGVARRGSDGSDEYDTRGQVSSVRSRATRRPESEGFVRSIQKRFRSAKAERAFDRTIGAQERKAQANASRSQASRAAVYEMRMGSTHRRSARMQGEGNEKGAFSLPIPFSLPAISFSATAARGIVVLAVVALTVFMLYPSCQNYYNETRQLQQLQAEYDALTAYNEQMQAQIDYLSTDEGLEEYARSELGWIREDESMATVEGVESSADGSSQSSTIHSPLNEDIPAPDTWYSGFLDLFFGYGK